jgi:hypothetical protein
MMLRYIFNFVSGLKGWAISTVIYAAYNWDAYVCPVPMRAATLVSNPSDRIGISGV